MLEYRLMKSIKIDLKIINIKIFLEALALTVNPPVLQKTHSLEDERKRVYLMFYSLFKQMSKEASRKFHPDTIIPLTLPPSYKACPRGTVSRIQHRGSPSL